MINRYLKINNKKLTRYKNLKKIFYLKDKKRRILKKKKIYKIVLINLQMNKYSVLLIILELNRISELIEK